MGQSTRVLVQRCPGLLPSIRHFENRRGEGPGDEVGLKVAQPHCKAENQIPVQKFPNCQLVIMILTVWQKKIKNLFTNLDFHYDGLVVKTNNPLGQLVIENNGKSQINLGDNLAKLFETGQILPLITNVKHILTTTSYFIHCDLIDKTNNLFNAKRSDLLAKFDITGKPYEKVRYDASYQQPFRDCSTDKYVNSITLSVRDQYGELFGFKGMPIEYELELN